MKQSDITRMIQIATTWDHSYAQKEEFHRLARAYLREVAKIMELPKGEFEIRSNKAGPACLGEVILHTRNIYIHLGGSYASESFYYRCVKGMKDFCGGSNAFMQYAKLCDMYKVAEHFVNYLDTHRYEWAA